MILPLPHSFQMDIQSCIGWRSIASLGKRDDTAILASYLAGLNESLRDTRSAVANQRIAIVSIRHIFMDLHRYYSCGPWHADGAEFVGYQRVIFRSTCVAPSLAQRIWTGTAPHEVRLIPNQSLLEISYLVGSPRIAVYFLQANATLAVKNFFKHPITSCDCPHVRVKTVWGSLQ